MTWPNDLHAQVIADQREASRLRRSVSLTDASPHVFVDVVLPIRLVSEANAHTHWRVRQRRAQEQRGLTRLALGAVVAELRTAITEGWRGPLVVTMTRLASRALDSDNAVGAAKHVRDGIADVLGVNDRVPWIDWRVAQERSATHGVRIRIER